MPSPAFHVPDSVEDVVALLAADPTARPLGGGTDLIVQMRSGRLVPGSVVDFKRIAGMTGVRHEGDAFVIGAATPMAGNLCNASPAADSVPALVAAGATCVVAGPSGKREVPVQDIPVAPGKTSLAPGEFVVEICLPAKPAGGGDAYLRSTPRTEMDIAVVGAGVSLVLDADGTCTSARVPLGAVGPTVVLVEEAGKALVGTKLDDDALAAMSQAVQAASNPIDDKRGSVSYRKAMAGVLARRAVLVAATRAGAKA